MKCFVVLAVVALSLGMPRPVLLAAEVYEEPYWETRNPVRIFDWDTLALIQSTKVASVKIDADSPEKLIAQLEKAVQGNKAAESLRFSFKRELWERPLSDGSTGKVNVHVQLELENEGLLALIRFVSELNGMTFSVKKGEIEFRPLVG